MIAFVGTELPPAAATADPRARRRRRDAVHRCTTSSTRRRSARLTAAIQDAAAGRGAAVADRRRPGGRPADRASATARRQFAGAMALGATGDEELAERVAGATARELRALGVNVNYAPVCDVANNPANPALGIRSLRRRSRGRRTARGGDRPGPAGRRRRRDGQALSRAPATPRRTRTTSCRWWTGRTPSWPRRELVPFRAALDAGRSDGHDRPLRPARPRRRPADQPVRRRPARPAARAAAVRRRDRHRRPGHARPGPGIGADRRCGDRPAGRRGPAARHGRRASAGAAGGRARAGAAAWPDRCRGRRRGERRLGELRRWVGGLRPAAARRRRMRRPPGPRRRAGAAIDHPRPQRRRAAALDARPPARGSRSSSRCPPT